MMTAFSTTKIISNKNCQIRECVLNIKGLSVAAIMYIFVLCSFPIVLVCLFVFLC